MEYAKKIKIISLMILVLSITYISGLVFSSASIQKRRSSEKIFDKSSIEKIEKIKVDAEQGDITLYRENNQWFYMSGGKKYPAAGDKIENFIDSVSNITKYQLSGKDSKSWEKFDLSDGKSKNAFFYDTEGKEIFSLHIGKTGPVEGGGEYVRTSLSEEAFLIDAPIGRYFNRDANYWSNLRILPENIDSNAVTSIKVRSDIAIGDETLKLDFFIEKEKSGNSYEWKNKIVDMKVEKNKADLLLNNIVSLTADSFGEEQSADNDVEIELETDSGRYIIDIKSVNDEEVVLGIRDSGLRFRASVYKVERILISVNRIFEE